MPHEAQQAWQQEVLPRLLRSNPSGPTLKLALNAHACYHGH